MIAVLALGIATVVVPVVTSTAAYADDATITCDGDGTSGKRVQLVYVHGETQTDRYTSLLPTFHEFSAEIDAAFVEASTRYTSSAGVRHVRFVHDSTCHAVVDDVAIPDASMTDESAVSTAIATLGYNRSDRKYLVWWDHDACGLSFGNPGSDSPDPSNGYNSGPNYSMVGAASTVCFSWQASAHELLHSLGAVNSSAPHATAYGHCWDDEDIMCYDDGGIPAGQVLTKVCLGAPENQIDCNEDDYFNPAPAPGSYLSDHWNVANSEFLINTAAAVTCHVTYSVTNDWGNGFSATLTIDNNSSFDIHGWQATFTFPGDQAVTSMWDATYVQQGGTVIATGATWNSDILAGQSASFGFNASYSGTNTDPDSFTLNGSLCS